jgi:two-component system, NtrC family, sensor kinase
MQNFAARSILSTSPLTSGSTSDQCLQNLWEDVSHGIFILDVLADGQEFRYTACNPVMARISPIPIDQLLNQTLSAVLPAELAQNYIDCYRRCVQTEQPITFEESCVEAGRESFWLFTANRLRGDDRRINQLLVTALEITDRVQRETEQTNRLTALAANENLFRRLVEDANDVLTVWGFDSVITYLSPGFRTTFGYEPDEWVGKSFVPLLHPDDVALCLQASQQVVATGKPVIDVEFRHFSLDGDTRWVCINILPFKNDDGVVVALQGILRDITDRKRQEEALQDYADRQAFLSQIINQIRHSLDVNVVIATTLQSVCELLDIDTAAFSWYRDQDGIPVWDVIQEFKAPGTPSSLGIYPASQVGLIDAIFANGEILQIDQAATYEEDPVHRAFLAMIGCQSELLLPIRTSHGQVGILICANHQSIRPWQPEEVELLKAVNDQLAIAIEQSTLYAESETQRQQIQTTLQALQQTQANMLQSEKMSSLGKLVAGIAHEINNPVNFIHGNISHTVTYTQDLLDLVSLYQCEYIQPTGAIAAKTEAIDLEFLQQDLPKSLASMQIGTTRIREIVKSLRLFSRLDEAEIKSVNLHEGIDSTLMILHSRLKSSASWQGIEVIKNYGDLPPIECYAGQLNQVFMNILANAIDALEERDRTRTPAEQHQNPSCIQITTLRLDNANIAIRIADNGCGIPAAVRSQIFDPFFTTKDVGKGTGMGMSISYQIVTEKHGGQLFFDSTLGEGTEFVIQIPIAQPEIT